MSISIKKTITICLISATAMIAGAQNNGKTAYRNEGKVQTSVSGKFVPKVKNDTHNYLIKLGNHARTFYIDSKPYYCDNGLYYQHVAGKGYEEIVMPEPVEVSDLPYGARRTHINGYIYYNAEGMWFQQVGDKFLIVKHPQAEEATYDTVPPKTYKATFGY